jgi:hypothetical protein
MYEYCSICCDPSSYFKVVEDKPVCYDCLRIGDHGREEEAQADGV